MTTSDSAPADLLERLRGLHPLLIDLSLDRLRALLARLGNPHHRLPPTLHVAGTNGKGSTCAFLRAMGEAAGLRVHVFTSPHLVRFNERIRLAGTLVADDHLQATLAHVEAANAGAPITVFEVVTAAAFLLFAEVPADLLVLEVGLGGRGDATNVIEHPAACAIASISLDHQEFLGDTLAAIAAEKAGILKPGIPAVTGRQPPDVLAVLDRAAAAQSTRLLARDRDWWIEPGHYQDAAGHLAVPQIGLPGLHQWDNAGIALAAIRAAALALPPAALAAGLAQARWPARMQRLEGHLAALLPPAWELWLDGGHNPGAAQALAALTASWSDRPLHLIVGMKQSKNPAAFLAPLLPHAASLWAVSEPDQHAALSVPEIEAAAAGLARPGPTVRLALKAIAATAAPPPARVLICGSLHLAGSVLRQDGVEPR